MTENKSEIKLSHKKYRLLLKKRKRKLKRQNLARQRDEKFEQELRKLESSPNYQNRKEAEEIEQRIKEEFEERERRRLHYLWLQREGEAMAIFKRRKEHEERVKALKEEAARKAREDLENLEKKERDEKKSKEVMFFIERDIQVYLRDALKDVINSLPEGNDTNEPWHNPIIPSRPEVPDNREICDFYSKTGACRFGDRCSRQHIRPESSLTVVLKGMFTHFCMEEMFHDEYDTDIALEFEESDVHQYFLDFYDDVLPEFKKIGKVIQFKVCCNQEQHLRGNVYVQYEKESDAEQAIKVFNGRFYGGKQLTCEYTRIDSWKKAICGLFFSKRCPKGRTCNFLHVFNNPRGEFNAADRDFREWESSRTRTPGTSFRNGSQSVRESRSPGSRSSSSSSLRRFQSKTQRNSPRRSSRRSRSPRTRSPLLKRSRRSRSRTPPLRSRRSRSRTPPLRSRRSRSRTPPLRSRSRSRTPPLRSRRSLSRDSSRSPQDYRKSLSRSQSPLSTRSSRSHHKRHRKDSKYVREDSRNKSSRKRKKSKRKSSSSSPNVEWVEKSTLN